jgi:predicted RNase H-like HicB family nuclease
VASQAHTLDEALANLAEAVELYRPGRPAVRRSYQPGAG